jgi:hypothetical protein
VGRDAFLTLLGLIGTLYAAARADDVADKGGSMVPFWIAYAAGAAAAICWWVFYSRNPAAVRRSRASEGRRRSAGVLVRWRPVFGLSSYR